MKKKAEYWNKLSENRVQCTLCSHKCILKPGQKGLCTIRGNLDGILYNLQYGESVSISSDPIEKKPLFHFYPGSMITSIAPNGCNLDCPFCQNYEISQGSVATKYISPKKAGEISKIYNSIGLSYTYTEPLVWFEYLIDAGEEVHKQNGLNVLISNGMINPEPLNNLLPLIDAVNIDLKTFSEDKYRKILKGDLKSVLNTIETFAANNIHIEVTTLIVTDFNDSEKEIINIAKFLSSINKEIPFHLSRYFPHYKYQKPPTDPKILIEFYNIAKSYLPHSFIGNFQNIEMESSFCPACNSLWISRQGYNVEIVGIKNNKCKTCSKEINFPL